MPSLITQNTISWWEWVVYLGMFAVIVLPMIIEEHFKDGE